MRFDVVVVGSLNQDVTVRVPHIPVPGETVLGADTIIGAGGKGANQAVAAARLGASVAMVGRVGGDAAGEFLRRELVAAEVDVRHVFVDESRSSGTALIAVDDAAENAIVVSPGANHGVTVDDVAAAEDIIATALVVLLQLEIPLDAATAAAEVADGIVILNPAPAAALPPALLGATSVLVPNQGELAVLAESDVTIEVQARSLAADRSVVVTLGSAGALGITADGEEHLAPAPRVEPLDTVGAGDCFCGALGVALAANESMAEALRFATHAAAIAVTRLGAQSSMPYLHEVREFLGTRQTR